MRPPCDVGQEKEGLEGEKRGQDLLTNGCNVVLNGKVVVMFFMHVVRLAPMNIRCEGRVTLNKQVLVQHKSKNTWSQKITLWYQ